MALPPWPPSWLPSALALKLTGALPKPPRGSQRAAGPQRRAPPPRRIVPISCCLHRTKAVAPCKMGPRLALLLRLLPHHHRVPPAPPAPQPQRAAHPPCRCRPSSWAQRGGWRRAAYRCQRRAQEQERAPRQLHRASTALLLLFPPSCRKDGGGARGVKQENPRAGGQRLQRVRVFLVRKNKSHSRTRILPNRSPLTSRQRRRVVGHSGTTSLPVREGGGFRVTSARCARVCTATPLAVSFPAHMQPAPRQQKRPVREPAERGAA
jgi:hypothetical protein